MLKDSQEALKTSLQKLAALAEDVTAPVTARELEDELSGKHATIKPNPDAEY